jgi:c-di-GMP-binding flagellar brake protein YcgR
MQEKRKYPRLSVGHRVEWKKSVDPAKDAASKNDVTKNTSEGGICLFVYEKFELGDILDLAIELPLQKVIHAKGRVRWVKEVDAAAKKYDIGFEFLEISDSDREEIKKVILQLLPYQVKNKEIK